jgi:hypothetical protein
MKRFTLLVVALLASLTGCPADDDSDPEPVPSAIEPTLSGPDYLLLGDRENVIVDWVDETTGKCTPIDPCDSESFVIDQVTCDGCTLEVFIQPSGEGRWVPAQGVRSSGTLSARLSTQTVGDKTMQVVVRTADRSPEIVKTLELRFQVDQVVGIAGACQTGPHQELAHQITVTPCSAARVAGDSLYVQPMLLTASGKTLAEARSPSVIEMAPPPTRRVTVRLMVNEISVDLGEYQNPAATLSEVTLTGTFADQTFTAKVALPPGT